ncbi:MAG: response regulator [Marinifilaceae bacterium]
MKILIIEDHPLLKTAMEGMLLTLLPNAKIQSFSYPSLALPIVQNHPVDLMLVDLEYSNGECGIQFVKEVKQKRSQIRAIAYTSHKLNQILKDIRNARFNSYINKDANEGEVSETIEAVLQRPENSFYESSSFIKHRKTIEEQEARYYSSDYEKLKSLTKTEKKAFQLIAEENTSSNSQLAEKLGVQLNTLKKHMNHIYRKLGVKSKDGIKHFSERTGMKE